MKKEELRGLIPIVLTETGELSLQLPIRREELGRIADTVGRLVAIGEIPLSDGRKVETAAKTIVGQIFGGLDHVRRVQVGIRARDSFREEKRKA